MNQNTIEAMVERWMGDEAFRERLRTDPIGTAENEGYVLSEEEKVALASLDLSQSDEELSRRASFAGG